MSKTIRNETLRETHTLMFALFEDMLKQQRKIGHFGDDDAEYTRQDRAASRSDVVVQFNREQAE